MSIYPVTVADLSRLFDHLPGHYEVLIGGAPLDAVAILDGDRAGVVVLDDDYCALADEFPPDPAAADYGLPPKAALLRGRYLDLVNRGDRELTALTGDEPGEPPAA